MTSTNYRQSVTLFHKPRSFGELATHKCFTIEGYSESATFPVYLKLTEAKALILTDGYEWTKEFAEDTIVFGIRYGLIENPKENLEC